jgi:hypothetical protein
MNISRLTTKPEEKSLGNFLAQFDRTTHASIIEQLARDDVDGAVCYISACETLKVSRVYGFGCAYTTLDRMLDMDAVLDGRSLIPRFYYRKDAEAPQAVACG